jgi:hypothetical protein
MDNIDASSQRTKECHEPESSETFNDTLNILKQQFHTFQPNAFSLIRRISHHGCLSRHRTLQIIANFSSTRTHKALNDFPTFSNYPFPQFTVTSLPFTLESFKRLMNE